MSSYSGTVSFADLVVLAGCAGVEKAAADAGHPVTVPFTPGRTDATQEMTDEESFSWMEPTSDGFRNFVGKADRLPAEYLLVDRANLLTLSAPEMTVLVGGMRAMGTNHGGSTQGVLTERPRQLTNDFFSSLLDMSTTWVPAEDGSYERRAAAGQVVATGSRVDLLFGSNSELRAVAEVCSSSAHASPGGRCRSRPCAPRSTGLRLRTSRPYLDHQVHSTDRLGEMPPPEKPAIAEPGRLTARGAATRARIVDAAADQMYAHGALRTSLDEVMVASRTSKSQLYHYFADKDALVRAVIIRQTERVLDGQDPNLCALDSMAGLRRWATMILDVQQQRSGVGGCPIGSLASELSDTSEDARQLLADSFQKWEARLATGLTAMQHGGELQRDADPNDLASAIMAALQGGLLLAQTTRDTRHLQLSLDMALNHVAHLAAVREG